MFPVNSVPALSPDFAVKLAQFQAKALAAPAAPAPAPAKS